MRLKKDNVERVATSEARIAKLKRDGYKEVESAEVESTQAVQESDTEAELDSLNVTQLRKLAKEKGLSGAGSLTREELLQLLSGSDEA